MFNARLAGLVVAVVAAGVSLVLMPAAALAVAPTILSESVSNLTATDATVNAVIEDKAAPNGALYQFQLVADPSEYQTTFDCPPEWEHSSVCLKMPERGEHSGTLPFGVTTAGLPEVLVSQDVAKARGFGNLKPNTTYHYWVITATDKPSEDVVEWEPPIVFGLDQTFTTPALPLPPRWFINGPKITTKKEPRFSLGKITLNNVTLKELTCENFTAGTTWNEVKEGTEKGFGETTGFSTWECKMSQRCEVTNEDGVTKEAVFMTAEGPPSYTEKGTEKFPRHTGSTSLPWTQELTEKAGNEKEAFVLKHKVKVWVDIPMGKENGGPGEGIGCTLLGGKELPFEEREGPTEKEAGYEISSNFVNGIGNGLSPSREGPSSGTKGCKSTNCTEKGDVPETGRLFNNGAFGDGFIGGELITAGSLDFELLTAQER
jgi:hypothetical protein